MAARRARRPAEHVDPPAMIGNSVAMRVLREAIRKYALSKEHLLIMGESGTGKELVVRHAWAWIYRDGGPRGRILTCNCAAVAEPLAESELFGHRRGSFTGADRDREGFFRAADGGWLVLDEVAELSPTLQAKLLRAVEYGEVQPVGSDVPVLVNVRVIAATNKDLEREVRDGRFREDLFYRLALCRICVPPLRERPDDIALLAGHFAGATPIAAATLQLLEAFPWPGNIRQLRSVIKRGVIESGEAEILPHHLPPRVHDPDSALSGAQADAWRPEPLAAVERKHIMSLRIDRKPLSDARVYRFDLPAL